jgi:hypothetical protein
MAMPLTASTGLASHHCRSVSFHWGMSTIRFAGPSFLKKTEGRKTYAETLFCVQKAAINALNQYQCCDLPNCETCFMVTDLRSSPSVQPLMKKKSFKAGRFDVDATLCDYLRDFHVFTQAVFHFEANICDNHYLAKQAANYSQRKYFQSQQNYDKFLDILWFEFRRSVSNYLQQST